MNTVSFVADAWFLMPIAALFVGVVALAPLGAQVLARGVVFIDLAVAQAAAAAALWASALIDHPSWFAIQALAVAGALACATVVAAMSRRWSEQREALIGLLYVFGASIAMLGARIDPHGRERMSELLAADVLWAQWHHIAAMACCACIVLLLRQRLTRDRIFFPLFAIVASLAVQVFGLFLVFAMLIAPSLWHRAGVSLAAAWSGAFFACAAGLAVSWTFDAPSGACVALALATYGATSALKKHPHVRQSTFSGTRSLGG